MFWAILATTFGCVLLFSAGKDKLKLTNSPRSDLYIEQWKLPQLWRLMGGLSILISTVLWAALFGLPLGLAGLSLCFGFSYLLLSIIKPKVLHLLSASVALFGASFIVNTLSYFTYYI